MAMPAALRPRPVARPDVSDEYRDTVARQRTSVRKFRGNSCPVLAWDGLRKDPDLWFDDGDCFVHLYACGSSRRGPSFRLHSADVMALASSYLLDECLYIRDECDKVRPASFSNTAQYDVYVPAPVGLARNDAYTYHLSTRNCFAFAAGLPVVGQRLGETLVQLWDRLQQWDSRLVTTSRFFKYCESQGYMNLTANTGHALSILTVAEHIRHGPIYIDAFVHCVGMQDRLDFNPEYVDTSDQSKVLIERAALEMDLHITQALHSLQTFLEEEINADYLGISKPAQDHLDRFRSFLINFYVEKLGYYPPPIVRPWKKRLWTVMYQSFQNLYEYLADTKSSAGGATRHKQHEEFSVAQKLREFDERHGFESLPHLTPLLPTDAQLKSRSSNSDFSNGLRNLRFTRSSTGTALIAKSLESASNTQNQDILSCSLVKEYQIFERQKLEEKISVGEARKIRWALVYSVLQMLTSIVRAPAELRDANSPPYPVCVLTTDCPPWSSVATDSSPKRDSFIAPPSIPIRVHRSDDSSAHVERQVISIPVRSAARHLSRPSASSNSVTSPTIDVSRYRQINNSDAPPSPASNKAFRHHRVSFIDALPVHPALRMASQNASNESDVNQSSATSSPMSRSDSQRSDTASTASSVATSSRNSSNLGDCESPSTDPSSEEDNCGTPSTFNDARQSYLDDSPTIGVDDQPTFARPPSVNAGCYTPSGYLFDKSTVPFTGLSNRASIASQSSSVYSDTTQQAADISDITMRGRQKLASIVQTRNYDPRAPMDFF